MTFSINVTLDGCVDHQEGIADDETHAFFTRLMDEGGAMLWGRVTVTVQLPQSGRQERWRCGSLECRLPRSHQEVQQPPPLLATGGH